jgi:CheY-like chemotaxis protein
MSEAAVVLVVEDDELLRTVIVDLLRIEGFAVADACNGQEALTLLRQTRPTVVVLDLLMPVMDGPTFLEHKLADPSFAATPVVIFSSQPAPELHAKPAKIQIGRMGERV